MRHIYGSGIVLWRELFGDSSTQRKNEYTKGRPFLTVCLTRKTAFFAASALGKAFSLNHATAARRSWKSRSRLRSGFLFLNRISA